MQSFMGMVKEFFLWTLTGRAQLAVQVLSLVVLPNWPIDPQIFFLLRALIFRSIHDESQALSEFLVYLVVVFLQDQFNLFLCFSLSDFLHSLLLVFLWVLAWTRVWTTYISRATFCFWAFLPHMDHWTLCSFLIEVLLFFEYSFPGASACGY